MKFRRKETETTQAAPVSPDETGQATAGADPAPTGAAPTGPFDVDAVTDGIQRVDLGAVLVSPAPGRELRLQVNEETKEVQAVMLAGSDGALELQAFAAPRNGDLWTDVRPQIAADIEQRGGKVSEREGRWGTELVCEMPVQREDGQPAVQPSRIIGINGPRWMLRATLLGRPAIEPEASGEWEDALAAVAVRRGAEARPVGDPLPAILPDDARRVR